MKRQFTATLYVLDDDKVLMIFHRKLNKWLPPGGHVEENELPHEAALRECEEETGVIGEIVQQENLWVERWNASSVPRPYLCLLEEIPPFGDEPAHQHMDQVFIGRQVGGAVTEPDAKWMTWEEISQLEGDKEIFEETRQTVRHLLDLAAQSC